MESMKKSIKSRIIAIFFRKINGVYMPNKFNQFVDLVYDWNVRNEDVWICAFPKSGTTWTQEMVWLIMNNLNYEKAKVDQDIRSPYFELKGIYEPNWTKASEDKLPLCYEDSFDYVNKISKDGPVCIKTHLPWVLLPKDIQESRKKPKIIYVSRNPKDVVVSLYHHKMLFFDLKESLDDCCKSLLDDKAPFSPYWQHVLPFWERRNQSNILFLQYEDMIKDLPSIIRKVAAFLEKSLTDEQVYTLSDYLSFPKMKNNKAVSKELHLKFYKLTDKPKGLFMRSGKANGYNKEMSPKYIEKFDKWIKENTVGTGYEIGNFINIK